MGPNEEVTRISIFSQLSLGSIKSFSHLNCYMYMYLKLCFLICFKVFTEEEIAARRELSLRRKQGLHNQKVCLTMKKL